MDMISREKNHPLSVGQIEAHCGLRFSSDIALRDCGFQITGAMQSQSIICETSRLGWLNPAVLVQDSVGKHCRIPNAALSPLCNSPKEPMSEMTLPHAWLTHACNESVIITWVSGHSRPKMSGRRWFKVRQAF